MNGSVIYIIAGVVIGLLLVAFIFKMTRNDGSFKCKFDERQELVRGRGFKYAFFTLITYNMSFALINPVLEKEFMDDSIKAFLGVLLAVLVYACYCIWHEGYFSLNENPKRVLIAFAIIALCNLIIGIIQISHHGILVDGKITFRSTNLFCALAFVIIFLTLLLKSISKQGEEV